jgi:signal recognition particle receptor subunit beta
MRRVVLVTGPFNSGKSTFVRTLGGRFSVDALIRNPVKPTTTVFMDFGTVEHNGYRIALFGTPGQPKFRKKAWCRTLIGKAKEVPSQEWTNHPSGG